MKFWSILNSKIILVLFSLVYCETSIGQQKCLILTSQKQIANGLSDPFFQTLTNLIQCPQHIENVQQILEAQFQNKKYLVANRGRNNPLLGSFSIFESFSTSSQHRPTDIFLGHFTHLKSLNGKSLLDLDQEPSEGKLIIELIAWDSKKGYYNFYELIGQGGMGQWFYRGDSKDILLDNQAIYLTQPTQFGQRLRCSGCHISGGPIMKELSFPHNDWWTKSRPLIFQHTPSASFLKNLNLLDTAESLSKQVQLGIQRLEMSPGYQNVIQALSIPAQLRPLFCEMEINLESDIVPTESSGAIKIPSTSIAGSFAGPLNFMIPKSLYQNLLQKHGLHFPETNLMDSDHAWLTPVKGYSDLLAIQSLKSKGLVDDKTILDIYFSTPIGSLMNKERCSLVQLVPNTFNWKPGFIEKLKTLNLPIAKALLQKMTEPSLTPQAYQRAITQWYQQTNQKLLAGDLESFFVQLLENRNAVFNSAISKNPRGQILEPGFRVIFPVPSKNQRFQGQR
ncbi:MAG: hypothetical protein J0M15_13240 [Deltaproteobacteria bacterium]|nr:hypothetical protein [Deltaproteobacteria bacterium]